MCSSILPQKERDILRPFVTARCAKKTPLRKIKIERPPTILHTIDGGLDLTDQLRHSCEAPVRSLLNCLNNQLRCDRVTVRPSGLGLRLVQQDVVCLDERVKLGMIILIPIENPTCKQPIENLAQRINITSGLRVLDSALSPFGWHVFAGTHRF